MSPRPPPRHAVLRAAEARALLAYSRALDAPWSPETGETVARATEAVYLVWDALLDVGERPAGGGSSLTDAYRSRVQPPRPGPRFGVALPPPGTVPTLTDDQWAAPVFLWRHPNWKRDPFAPLRPMPKNPARAMTATERLLAKDAREWSLARVLRVYGVPWSSTYPVYLQSRI